jgi:hypothetical protein
MGVAGNLRHYTEFQTADAIKAAAENLSGGTSEGIGMGMGFAIANKMSHSMSGNQGQQAAPPPIPDSVSYFIAIDGQQVGPVNSTELVSKIKSASISADTLVWNQQLVEWTPAGKVAELASHFTLAPPPIPSAQTPDKK